METWKPQNYIPMRIAFFLFFLYGISVSLPAQFREQAFGGPAGDYLEDMRPTSDGGYILTAVTRSFSDERRSFLLKLDAAGDQEWLLPVSDNQGRELFGRSAFELADGTFLLFANRSAGSLGAADDDLLLLRVDAQGSLLSETLFSNLSFDLRHAIATSDGNYLLCGNDSFNSDGCAFVAKVSPAGSVLWSGCYGRDENDYFYYCMEDNEGHYVLTGVSFRYAGQGNSGADGFVMRFQPDGTVDWEYLLAPLPGSLDDAYDVVQKPDGNYWITGVTNVRGDKDVYLLELSRNSGAPQHWQVFEEPGEQYGNQIIPVSSGGYIMAGSTENTPGSDFDAFLLRFDENGNTLWRRNYGGPEWEFGYQIRETVDGSFAFAGWTQSFGQGDWDIYFLNTNAEGQTLQSWATGRIAFDTNLSCTLDTADIALSGWIVQAEGGPTTLYGISNEQGRYAIALDTGDYLFRLIPPNGYWEPCDSFIPITILPNDTSFTPLLAQPVVDCPYPEASTYTTPLSPCQNSTVVVNYCNEGTAPADDAYIEVELDTLFEVVSSTIPWSFQSGNTYTFSLGGLSIDTCGFFKISVRLSCDATPGQAHPVLTHIYPDSLCLPPLSNYSGAFLEAKARCEGDSLRFTLSNTGGAPMSSPQEYVVIEDAVLYLNAPFELGEGEAVEIPLAADGATYFLAAPQEPGAPGSPVVSALAEGCGVNEAGGFSTGFANQFGHSEEEPAQDVLYQENSLPLAANAVSAHPVGYGEEHFIRRGEELKYHIQFGNPGQDTVFQLVVRDTLSPFLDLSSVRPGAASHPYTFRIEPPNVLTFTFHSLELLPELQENGEAAGFVKFRVAQKPGLPAGTVIENRASFQYDFGRWAAAEPAFHTIGEEFVVVQTEDVFEEQARVQVFPNPFREQASFRVEGISGRELQLELFDLQGRLAHRQSSSFTDNLMLRRESLPPGLYIFRLSVDGVMLAQGKVLVQ